MTSTLAARRRRQPEQTRRRILDATVDSLVHRGYSATTTLEVQRRAGVSRGALLHHFPTRAGLVVAALLDLLDRRGDQLRAAAAELRATEPASRGADLVPDVVAMLWRGASGALGAVYIELWAAARTDHELRAVLTEHEPGLTALVVELCREAFGPDVAERPGFELLCQTTVQLIRGLALTALVNPQPALQQQVLALWERLFRSSATGRIDLEASR